MKKQWRNEAQVISENKGGKMTSPIILCTQDINDIKT